MHTENAVVIHAPISEVYALASAVERWPEILPHYRWVRVLRDDGDSRLVEMAAHRDHFPVQWWALQTSDPRTPSVAFRHVRGVTAGMDVLWRFEPIADGGGVRVSIQHDLQLGWRVIGSLAANRVIGPFFVSNIAEKTLKRIKEIAEADSGPGR